MEDIGFMYTEKIGYAEAIALINVVMINKIILNTPKDIIANTGSSAWLNVLYISLISVLVACIITHLLKKFPGRDILDISEFLGGKTLKGIIGIAYMILLVLLTTLVIKNLSETLKIIYFKTSPILYIVLFFIVSSIICSKYPIKVFAKANLIVTPIIFLSVIIILLSSIKNFMPQRIFPILGYGVDSTFFSGLSNIFSFSGMLYLLFLPPLLDKPEKMKRMSIIAITISAVYLFLSVTCLLLSLSFTFHSDESFSLYVLTRSLEYGRFIQRVDAIFILIWILAIISYINLPISLCVYIFKKLTNISDTSSISYSINLLILALCIIPIEYAIFANILGKFVQYSFLILFFAISIPILIFANLKLKLTSRFKKMKNVLKRTLLISLVFIMPLTCLSGCYDARGIEDLAYVTALGLDISENGILSMTFQISVPESSSESGSSQSSKTKNATVQCSSIDSGISLVNSYISKQINLSHCKVLVFSEEIATLGLNDYLNTFSNNIEIRPDCNVIITRSTAQEFIENATPSIETITARYYEVALHSSEYTGYTTSTEFATFVNDVKNSFIQGSAILGGVNSGENKMPEEYYVGIDANYLANSSPIEDSDKTETFGTAVFKDDKLVGELTGLETLCFLLVSNKINSCTISVPSPFKTDSGIDLFIACSKSPKINVNLINGIPHISIDLFIEARGLTLNETVDYTSISYVKQLEDSAELYIKNQVENFLYKTSKEFNSDICGFGKYVLSKYYTWQDWENADWAGNYINSVFDLNVNISILSGSEFNKSP